MFTLRLLGGVSLDSPSGRITGPVLQQRRIPVLAMLAACGDQGCSLDRLVGYIWPEYEKERARHNLANAVYVLRYTLGEGAVLASGEYLRLDFELIQADVVAFERALQDGHLEEAAGLYGGPFLEGFFLSDAPEFERWVESERQRLFDALAGALEKLAEEAEAAGDHARAVDWWKRATLSDPYNSRYVLRLMQALVEAGDPGNAIQHSTEHARLLREELEAEPAPEVLELAERLKRETAVSVHVKERPAAPAVSAAAEAAGEPLSPSLLARLSRPLAFYAAISFAIVVVAHIFTLQFGLPGWFFRSVVVLLFACLPVVIVTASVGGTAGARGWVSWRNSVALIALAFALLGLAATGYMAMRALGIGPWGTLIAKGVLQESDVIVLADFEDRTGDSTLALTVTEVFRSKLGESRVVGVMDRAYVDQVLREQMVRDPDARLTYDLARKVAIRKGLKALVAGSIGRLGSNYVLTARLVAAETGRELYSHQETAEGRDPIMSAINRLSARLLERIGESLKTVRGGRGMSSFAWTSSLEAARLCTEAVRALSRAEYEKAVDRASRAIEIDSLMASAYGTRASALVRLHTDRAQAIADRTRAYELRHRAPPRFRYFIEAHYHGSVTGDREKQLEAYDRVLELGPEWSPTAVCPCPGELVATVNNLGWHYYTTGDYARAEEMFRRRLAMDSARGSWTTTPWINLTRVLFDQGRIDEAEEAFRRWHARMPGNPDIPFFQAAAASARGDYEAAALALGSWRDRQPERLLRQARFNRYMARLPQVQGNLAEAEDYLRRAMAVYEEDDRGDEYLESGIELASLRVWFLGDTVGALETVAAALERRPLDSIEPIERPYAELAGFYAFAGTPERARGLLAAWEAAIPPEFRWRAEIGRHTASGAVALAEGRAEDALAEYRLAQEAGACRMCALPWLAQAYEIAGEPDSAMAVYERYVTTPWFHRVLAGGSLASPAAGLDPFWLPVIYERLGDLYEQRGDTAKAINYYGKLVDLWKDADPELQPRVQAARRAIEAL
jgi:DNA-binding SARP family transcriptional activator